MTQTARPPAVPWIVSPGEINGFEHTSYIQACRGHVRMGKVLGYFMYEASWEAKRKGIDLEAATSITVTSEHETILAKVQISQNSLTTYLKQLVTWGFLKVDAHRHTYEVYFHAVREAVEHPPEPLPKKPRGKSAPKQEPTPESQNCERQEQITKLRMKITKLRLQYSNLGKQITNLSIRLSNLGFLEEDESALEQVLTGDQEAPRILRITENLKKDLLVALSRDESSFTLEEKELSSVSSTEESQAQSTESLRDIPTEVALQKDKADTLPPAPPPSPDKTVKKEKNKNRITPMKDCSPEVQERRRRWQEYFNKRRGGEPLPKRGEQMNESTCIAFLVDTYTDAQITAIDTFVITEKFPHRLPVNQHKVGGHIIFEEAQNAREVLKERRQWPTCDTPSDNTSPPEMEKPKNYRTNFNDLYKQEHMAAAGAHAGRMYA